MPVSTTLTKYSFGVGDRFAMEAEAQLAAFEKAAQNGLELTPVWNKSNREHLIVGSDPVETRAAADAAVRNRGWKKPYFCDADHVNLATVDRFLAPCDFFTIDVADRIAKPVPQERIRAFTAKHPELIGEIRIEGLDPLITGEDFVRSTAGKYLAAVESAADIYRHIAARKTGEEFVTEISMDETDAPQTPPELLIILAAIADSGIPVQTIAPKFTGRFNKGVDYVGDAMQFQREFAADISVIRHAVATYGLPRDLKLSVHSGSDKFSIYPAMQRVLRETGAGVHVKTAGTTWLEEVIGLAESGGDGLALAKEIYAQAFEHVDELCAPYASVIDIDPEQLPCPTDVSNWSASQFTAALKHAPQHPEYNSSLRQLLHVGFKIAAKMGDRYRNLVAYNRPTVARNVAENLFDRHIAPIFLGESGLRKTV